MRPEVREVLERCRDNVASPYIVHRLPVRLSARDKRSKRKDHHTQISRSQASRAFTAVVRRCDFFAGHKNPPTLYECKSLGVAQLRRSGWSLEDTQRLAGHRSSRMTEKYAQGHEAPFDEVGTSPAMKAGFVTETLL